MSLVLRNCPVHPPIEPQLSPDAAKKVICGVGNWGEDPDHTLPKYGVEVQEPGRHFAGRGLPVFKETHMDARTLKNNVVVAPLVYVHFPHLIEHLYMALPPKKQCQTGKRLCQWLLLPIKYNEREEAGRVGCLRTLTRLENAAQPIAEVTSALVAFLKKTFDYKHDGVFLRSDTRGFLSLLMRGDYQRVFPLIRERFPRLEFTVEQFGAYQRLHTSNFRLSGFLAGQDGSICYLNNDGSLGDEDIAADDVAWAEEIGVIYRKRKLGLLIDHEWEA